MYGLIQAWGSKIVPQVYLKPLLKNLITSAVVAALNSLVSVRPLFLFENEAITDGHQKLQDFRKSHWGILRTILKPRDFHNSNHPAIVCCAKSPINVCWPLRAWLICLQISFCFFFSSSKLKKKSRKKERKLSKMACITSTSAPLTDNSSVRVCTTWPLNSTSHYAFSQRRRLGDQRHTHWRSVMLRILGTCANCQGVTCPKLLVV